MKMMHLLSLALLAAGIATMDTPAEALIAPLPASGRLMPPPGYAYQWIPPAYQIVSDRLWIAERREWVSDLLETSPGRLERVWREVIIPGYWEATTRQVVISPGYWQLVRMEPAPPLTTSGTVGVEGYGSVPAEDLSKFSPLSEWPSK